jgi:hypothetical protein
LVPVAALAGVWFGWWLGKTERDQQWRRDKQIDAYTELIAVSADATIAAGNRLSALTAEQRADASRLETASQVKFHNALHKATLVSPSLIRAIIDQLGEANRAVLTEMEKEDKDRAAVEKQIVRGADLRKELVRAARKDLGFER